jgi:hypothetical protein
LFSLPSLILGRLWSIAISGHLSNLDRSGTVLSFFLHRAGHSAASLSLDLLHAIAIDRASLQLHSSRRFVLRDMFG